MHFIASGLQPLFPPVYFTEAQLGLVEIFTQLFFKTIYCIIFGTLCLTTKKEITFVTAGKRSWSVIEKKNLGPFKNYKVLGLPETTEQEIYS